MVLRAPSAHRHHSMQNYKYYYISGLLPMRIKFKIQID